MILWLTLILAVLGGLALLFLGSPTVVEGPPELFLAGGAVTLLLVIYLATSRHPMRGESTLKKLIAPAAFCAAVLGALAYGINIRAPFQNLLASAAHISPGITSEPVNGPKALRIRRNPLGQYVARGGINRSAAEFLVDTGAAVVLLRQSDAEKAGIDISALTFSVPVETANGTSYAAPVRVRSLSIGPIQIDGMEALVAAPGSLNESLLGMSFLRRLRSYELAGDFLTLRE
jgi:aspartyl protease family protein